MASISNDMKVGVLYLHRTNVAVDKHYISFIVLYQ